MPDDLEQRLRTARNNIPEPDAGTIERVLRRVTDDMARSRPAGAAARQNGRRRLGALALVTPIAVSALLVGGAIGAVLRPVHRTTRVDIPRSSVLAARITGPGFVPAAGWNTEQTGITQPPQVPSAIAANYVLTDTPGTFPPTSTLLHIPAHGIVITLNVWASKHGFDLQQHPVRTLPLRFSQAKLAGPFEGAPTTAQRYFIGAKIHDHTVEVNIFVNHHTPASTLQRAIQAELDRIVVPSNDSR